MNFQIYKQAFPAYIEKSKEYIDKIIELKNKGLSYSNIAKLLKGNWTKHTIYKLCYKYLNNELEKPTPKYELYLNNV